MATAATVEPIAGKVSLNSGKGFKDLSGVTSANRGAKVMTGPNSEATIVYEDGCRVHVAAGQVVSVTTSAICHAGAPTQVTALPDATMAIALGVAGVAAVIALQPASP